MGVLFAILGLSFLIFFHELGHFLFARLFGVRVLVFSIGFGKKLITKQYKGTEYTLSLIPLGGYVKLKGEITKDSISKDSNEIESSVSSQYDKDSLLS
ncbi:MAG: site-2 protease family protein, partial [Helicobacter sp.]|uniref:site-2 protease family protein n=1 Tax=Helicobacter sp. TaxID=218 RepID=UPI002A90D188